MFNPSNTVIDAFVGEVLASFHRAFSEADAALARLLEQATRMALQTLAGSDAHFHDMEHTVLVVDVQQQILWGRQMARGDVTPTDWTHTMLAALHHDIGFVRGLLAQDQPGQYVIDEAGNTVELKPGATDAAMAPHHIARSCMFLRERFAAEPRVDVERLTSYIERTRFPVPKDRAYAAVGDFAGLVRAADLIGQLADPRYIQKLSRLYGEFVETGESQRWGYENAGDLRANYPSFFVEYVRPYISDGLRYLRRHPAGQQWIANLFRHVHSEQHGEPSNGPEPGTVKRPSNAVPIGARAS